MATIYKRRESRPIPDGAKIVKYRGKLCAVWANAKTGKAQRAALNAAGDRILQEAEFYTIQYFDEDGRRKKHPTRCADKDAAQQVANDLEAKVALRRQGIVDPAQEKFAREGRRPIEEHVADFHAELVARENTTKHVEETVARINYVVAKSGATHVKDLAPSTVLQVIKGIHDAGRSLVTANSYLRAIKSFTNWLRTDTRTTADILAPLSLYCVTKEAPRHARREVSLDELIYLLAFVEQYTTPTHRQSGPDRAMLYRVALGTGYRVNELRSLMPISFDLDGDPPTISVEAAFSKRRQKEEQPIQRDLAEQLKPWLEGRSPDERVFQRMSRYMARTLHADLKAARSAWIGEAESEVERQRRTDSDTLRYENAAGEFADFHALRHTYISGIVAGGASVKTAQELARHSTPTLTFGRYAKTRLHDVHGAVESLPDLSPVKPPLVEQATGTDCQRRGVVWGQMRGQLGGETGRNVSGIGKQVDGCLIPVMPTGDDSQVVTLSAFGNKKATSDGTWLGAEGTGVEPATGFPAPDFESGR